MTEEQVEVYWENPISLFPRHLLLSVCVSHERLRAELEGAEILLADAEEKLRKALALTDTGSTEFHEAFPPEIRPVVQGWRVVEKIREILLG